MRLGFLSSKGFREMATRLRPQLKRPQLRRASDADVAASQRKPLEKVVDPYDDHIRAAQAQPEVYGHGMLNYVDSVRGHTADPAPQGKMTIPGHAAADGSDDHGW